MNLEPSLLATRDGKNYFSNGMILPVISGGSDTPPAPPETPPAPPSERTFTQAEMNTFLANEKRQGKDAGMKEALEKLGVKTLEEAQEILTRTREAEDQTKSQIQKDQEKAQRDREQAEAAKAEAAKERLAARIERALSKAGVSEEEIDYMARMVVVADDADAAAVTAAVDELREKMPRLFGKDEGKSSPPSGGRGNPPPPPRNPPKDTSEQAKSLLASRHPSKVKS